MINVFATALAQPSPTPMPPPEFNLKVSELRPTYAATVNRALLGGQLDGYICEGELWVSRSELHHLVAPGHCTYDQHDDCCYIPPECLRDS